MQMNLYRNPHEEKRNKLFQKSEEIMQNFITSWLAKENYCSFASKGARYFFLKTTKQLWKNAAR